MTHSLQKRCSNFTLSAEAAAARSRVGLDLRNPKLGDSSATLYTPPRCSDQNYSPQ